MTQIIGLFGSLAQHRPKRDWSNQDLAELYRVESTLIQAGLRIDTGRGVSDEGDPWFVFCHGDSGNVIAHFARIDGRYVIASSALAKTLRGPDLGTIVRTFVQDNPISLPANNNRRGNVVFHPEALLTIFVASLLVMSSPDEGVAAIAGDDDAVEPLHDIPGVQLTELELDDSSHDGPDIDLYGLSQQGAAQIWLEQESSTDGWTFALLEENATEAIRAADFLKGMKDHSESGSGQTDSGPTLQSRDSLIDFFQASHTDIAVLRQDDGPLVMLDRSDVMDGDSLSLVSWAFEEDGTTLAILGHSSVIADAVALVT